MAQGWNKFMLLMWKNWLLQFRKPLQSVIEILAPVIFAIILVVIRSLVDPEHHDAVTYPSFCLFPETLCPADSASFSTDSITGNESITLMYSPNSTAVNDIMQNFHNLGFNITGFKSSSDMVATYSTGIGNTTFACIQFDDALANAATIGDDVKVAIRFPSELRQSSNVLSVGNWQTNLIYPLFQTAGPRSSNNLTGASPNYFQEGFLTLQTLLSIFITYRNEIGSIESLADFATFIRTKDLPYINMRRYPYAAWTDDILLTVLTSFVSMVFMLSFVYTCINTVKAITAEKEKQLKEAMKIMGLPNWLHWLAWFIKCLTFLMISIVLMVVLLKVRWYRNTDFTVFTYANPFVLVIFLFFYICATITFCFAISVFFSKANTASTIAGLAWFLSYAPYSFMQNNYATLSLGAKLGASLGSNTAMAFGFQIVLMYEGTGEGVQFDNIWSPNTPDDNISLGLIMVILLVDTILYLLIALYVEAIFPGDYGVPQKWYFPFTASYWCGQQKNSTSIENFDKAEPQPNEFFEVEPKNLHPGVRILNLCKIFNEKTAVRDLSLNMYRDQITVLLGHNGAGKTTTMSMLTGMYTPTSGTAIISGYDIRTEMDQVRDSLGLCPQHNVIFDELTVAEHLYFFSRLKGMRGADIDQEITKYVNLLELEPKRDAKSSSLSGGMKRKLCVGVALCGDSKVVMLDEPTAGMDPSARRALWDLLLTQKTGRTMLLTTHFMDEADLLGDRIAIMAGGKLQCCGSSFFLKKKYGAGYHLIMDKSSNCNPDQVTALLQKHIPNVEVHGNIGSELTYLLAESQSYLFEPMLRDLEQNSDNLGINSYGISLTTLEEVFMKVGADHGQEEMYNGKQLNGNGTIKLKIASSQPEMVDASKLLLNQIKAMSMKKVLSTLRSWVLLVIQILMPVIFLAIAMIVMRQQNQLGDLPSMPLDLSRYVDPVLLVEGASASDGFSSLYKDFAGSAYKEVDSIENEILKLTAETPTTVRRRYLGGAMFNPTTDNLIFNLSYTVYFNNDPYHTPAVTLGVALNTIARHECDTCSIEVSNYPLPFSTASQLSNIEIGNTMGFQLSFNVCFSMAFVSSFYILFIVRERASKSKHLQFVSGVKVYVFWLVTLFWDFITYIITVVVLILSLVAFQEDGFKTALDLARLFLILLYFGWAMLPMMYLFGFLFDVPSTGYTRMTLFSIFTGCAAYLVIQVMGTTGLNLEHVADILHWIFLIVPHYSLATGIRDTYTLYSYISICNNLMSTCLETGQTEAQCEMAIGNVTTICTDLDENYYRWETPGIGRNLVYSFVSGLVMLLILLVVEYQVFSNLIYWCRQKFQPKVPLPSMEEDFDVWTERNKIAHMSNNQMQQNYTVAVRDLTKYYKNFLAVNGLSLGVGRKECFGLLGINGAGKTTTFKMLTGDVKMSYGDAWVNGRSIKTELKEVQKSIGYCPQFDALLDNLTARETLKMFSLLRGIAPSSCNGLAEQLAMDFDFGRHLDKQVRELSGGNKRKLSTSLALIGNPPVIYLDEPTTGMDPATKRYLWNVLCDVRDSNKTIVLTSHSMEECEALCTRIAIMVNGIFKCLGSTQHLKSKFAEGYTLTIKVEKPENSSIDIHSDTANIHAFIQDKFPGSILREKHEELLTYYITDKSVPWSKMFGILEKAKRSNLNIEDYSLGQSSLEQVFLTFTKQQYQT